jgi:hypothetical protein
MNFVLDHYPTRETPPERRRVNMAWVAPQHSRGNVDKAGRTYLAGFQFDEEGRVSGDSIDAYFRALDVINNWRSSHSFPLNTFQTTLRKKGRKVDPDCLVAQRIKRLSSVALKLKRYDGLRLSQIQDIGGCRIVLRDVAAVKKLVRTYERSDIKHSLARVDDYLEKPQFSGYRGIHMIYKYYSDKNDAYNDLKVEIQVRSQYQHAWATAVETVGTFLNQSLKSSIGEDDWLRFFALMGTTIAFQEGTAPVAGTPGDYHALIVELRDFATRLDVINRLEVYGQALQLFEETQEGQYYLLELDPEERQVKVRSYTRGALAQAQDDYLEVEKRTEGSVSDAVLVSVDSLAALQRAYPNYFLDTRVFIGLVKDALEGKPLVIGEQDAIEATEIEPG